VELDQILDERDPANHDRCNAAHRLVREIAHRGAMALSNIAARRTLVAMLAAVYPIDGYSNPASWPRCAALTPHLVAICKSETADAADSAQRAGLLGRAGNYLHGRAAYSAARPLLERGLAISEKALGPEIPTRWRARLPRQPSAGTGRPGGGRGRSTSARWEIREKPRPEHRKRGGEPQ